MGTAGLLLVHAKTPSKNCYYYYSPTVITTTTRLHKASHHHLCLPLLNSSRPSFRTLFCCFNSTSTPKSPRGFGSPPPQRPGKDKNPSRGNRDDGTPVRPPRKSSSKKSVDVPKEAPVLNSRIDGKSSNLSADIQFEERLQVVKRSAFQQKRAEEEKQYGAIDYDAPIEPKSGFPGLGTKIGAGIAVLVFGLVFAFGDFLPSGSESPSAEAPMLDTRISSEERETLKKRLEQFEGTLSVHPEDSAALEGKAVTLTELGEYSRAATLLEDLSKRKPNDPDVFRLLGEVKYQLKDYDGSARGFKTSAMMSKTLDFEVTRGLTNALLAAQRPNEAVQVLLASREQLNKEKFVISSNEPESSNLGEKSQIDPIQVDLLLGKAYSDWGHVGDAVSVYDQLISSYPNDFRGYLAKGIILKENGNVGDAERMFIQARFFAPDKAKALVDKYSR